MADFGKLNFSTSFNPTSAFPLDARCYFTSLEFARTAAASAEEVGSTNTVYYYGMKVVVDDGTTVKWYTIQRDNTLRDDSISEAVKEEVKEEVVESVTETVTEAVKSEVEDIVSQQIDSYISIGTKEPTGNTGIWFDISDDGLVVD